MAPTPVDVGADNATKPTNTAVAVPNEPTWSTATIVSISIVGFFAISAIVVGIGFWYHRRAERNKLPPEARPQPYRPYRSSSSKSGLLANAAPSPEDDKRSMFSRDSRGSVSLYVDTDMEDRRASMETVSLIPLHITPAEERNDPMESTGSGVSRMSSRYSVATGTSGGLSPIPAEEEEDLGVRKTRARSTSTTSMRYYGANTAEPTPQIPKIVHTPSS